MGLGKNALKFGRRKSSATAFDDAGTPTAPAVSSFRVLERPQSINFDADNQSFGRIRPVSRPFNSPLANLRGRSVEELSAGLNRSVKTSGTSGLGILMADRTSAGTTVSGSSGYYESSDASMRHSSSSTLPSSVDADRDAEDDNLFPRRAKTAPEFQDVPLHDETPPPVPSMNFTARAARAMSFGSKQILGSHSSTNTSFRLIDPPKPARISTSPPRERAMTTSSYASTAKPEAGTTYGTRLESTDFGGDFDCSFSRPATGDKHNFLVREDSEPTFPLQTYSNDGSRASPNLSRDSADSPWALDRSESRERLMAYSPIGSPTIDEPPAPPAHRASVSPTLPARSKAGYASVPDRYSSPAPGGLSQDDTLDYLAGHIMERSDEADHEAPSTSDSSWAKANSVQRAAASAPARSSNPDTSKVHTRMPSGHPSQASAGALRNQSGTSYSSASNNPYLTSESRNSTPRAAKAALAQQEEEPLFDSSPVGPPSRALPPQQSQGAYRTMKRMTTAQFEQLQRRGEQGSVQGDNEDAEQQELDEEDDEDDAEKAKKIAQRRQRQEANMAVYRQQMKKVTGGGPADLPASGSRPAYDRSSSSAPATPSGLYLGGTGGQPPVQAVQTPQANVDDEDVPLGILQAHGFPNAGRPPLRSGSTEPIQQIRPSAPGSTAAGVAMSAAGGAANGNLPPFARGLPVDPYFGSRVIKQSNRESLGMSGAASVYGMSPSVYGGGATPPPHVGHSAGLVGIIADEERTKAARRGSPNPVTGTYGPTPSNFGQPGMGHRTVSLGSIPSQAHLMQGATPNPMMNMPGMPTMPQMPMGSSAQQDQMQQFMQMQMQVMQNMQNMMAMQQQQMGQTPSPQQPQAQDYLSVPGPNSRAPGSQPSSVRNAATPNGRAMSMMQPSLNWDIPKMGRRPVSAMPQTYLPSGTSDVPFNGLAHGRAASIAPSERSNIGQPSRYRPVTMLTDPSGRTNSLSSMNMLQLSGNDSRNPSPEPTQQQSSPQNQVKSTIRAVDKPKGAMKVFGRPVSTADEEDEERGWAEMRKKREDRKKSRFTGKENTEQDTSLTYAELVNNLD